MPLNKFFAISLAFFKTKQKLVMILAHFQQVKAKDLIFKAKAKDFKLCPRGQGSAVATGGLGGRAPPNDCLCPPFWFTQDTVFGTSRIDKTTCNDGKRNNFVIKGNFPLTFSRFFAKLLAINCCT